MKRIESQVRTDSAEFKENAARMRGLADELRERMAVARNGGSDSARKLHTDRGKLLARDRIDRLIDPGTPFLELSTLAANGLYDDAAPGAGIVTGIGQIHGRRSVVVANDATVKGGTYFPITVKKHLRAQEIALENRLPCVYLVDSGAQYLDGTTDITRTVAIGTPSAEMRERFTLVLKGHIALATCRFPKGTTGGQIDALARQYLWRAGLDFDHGTGHGVGSYLNVHEGPQRISKLGTGQALEPGMMQSDGIHPSKEAQPLLLDKIWTLLEPELL